MKVVWLCLIAALAGCVDEAAAPAIEPEPTIQYEAECNGVFYARLVQFSEFAQWLPPGFTAADASRIANEAGYPAPESNRGFMAVFGNVCETHQELHFGVLVEPPAIDIPHDTEALHWYEVALFLENFTHTETLQAMEFPIEVVEVYLVNATIEPAFDGRVFEATDLYGNLVMDLTTFGTAAELAVNNTFYSWHTTPAGTQLSITHVDLEASIGDGNCVSSREWINQFVGSCERGKPETIYGTVDHVLLQGSFFSYPGVFPR